MLHELSFYDLASTLLECSRQRLALTTAGEPDRVCVVPGAIAWDDCDCGQLAVSVTSVYPSAQFPIEVTGPVISNCDVPYIIADLTIQVIRCAPSPYEGELSVSCERLDLSSREVITDAHAVRTGTLCCLQDLQKDDEIVDFLVRTQTFVGPQGGCVGSELLVTVGLDNACPCG